MRKDEFAKLDKLSNKELAKLPLNVWQEFMKKKYKISFGKPTRMPGETAIAYLYDKGKKETAIHLAWTYYGYGDYKYGGHGSLYEQKNER